MYFSVKQPIKIAGKVFQPCICYELTSFFTLNVEKLVTEGRATMYEKEVFFQNGKIIEHKEEIKGEPVVEQPIVQEEVPTQEKPKTKKKSKKESEEETF